jgi:imidazolonepropionase-like amidohydrolase
VRIVIVVCAVLFGGAAHAAAIVIHAGWLLVDPGQKPLREQTVVVTDGKITAVETGYQPAERYGADAMLIDLQNRFVLPGLIDLHKHISLPLDADEATFAREDRLALMTAAVAKAALDAGVTTLRDVGDNVGVTFAVRDAINSGVMQGPRIFAAGRVISSTGGHGTTDEFQGSGDIERLHGGCDGAESCRRVVRENIEAGSDWIKVTVSGSGGAPSGLADAEPIMLPDEVHAVLEAAQRGLRPVAAHAHSKAAIKLALEQGARTIEHGTYFDDSCVRLFKSKGAFLVPTAHVAEFVSKQIDKFSGQPGKLPPEGLRRWTDASMKNPGRAWRAGIRLGVGSDSGSRNDAHATAREVELFVASGVPASDAIAAATVTNAEILGMKDQLGRIRKGFEADLIAVDGDPVADVAKLHAVTFVMKGGAVIRGSEIAGR